MMKLSIGALLAASAMATSLTSMGQLEADLDYNDLNAD